MFNIFRKNNARNLTIQQIEAEYKNVDSRGMPTLDKFIVTTAPQPVPVNPQPGPTPPNRQQVAVSPQPGPASPNRQPVAVSPQPGPAPPNTPTAAPPQQPQVPTKKIGSKGKEPAQKKRCVSPTPGPSGVQNAAPCVLRISNSNYVSPVSC